MNEAEDGPKESVTPYYFIEPREGKRVPVIVSIPHSGTEFPADLAGNYNERHLSELDDTDWYLDQLYDFAADIGVTVIHAKYSRWVIDLNREPNSKPLYDDGRLITALCPTTDFLGADLYREKGLEPDDKEINRRLSNYFFPYHQKIDSLIESLRGEFGRVLFWDAHSIRRSVATISKTPFPDLILGNNEGKTASDPIIRCALENLRNSSWQVNHNDPFKGGYLTRSKGDPANGVNALQLEMSKDLYMKFDETEYDEQKAGKIKKLLRGTFEELISLL
ncbi:MAG: N-formylglutamate amidohydrolase [Pyrinomonadaceae bacterium]